jgi:hypothetical protein
MYLNENKYIYKVKLGKYKPFVINIFCMWWYVYVFC